MASRPGTLITIAGLATLAAVGRTLVRATPIAGLMVRTWVARRWVTPRRHRGWAADTDRLPVLWEDTGRPERRIMDELLIMVAPTSAPEQIMVITMMSDVCAALKVCDSVSRTVYVSTDVK